MPKPNIFNYATKELSQDAFICWLVACAAEDGNVLQQCGLAFIGALMKHGREQYRQPCAVAYVSPPKTQYNGIDVYFQARVDGSMVSFVIEDKVGTSMHSGQLKRYSETVRSDDQPEDEFRFVYYKTGYIYSDERAQAEEAEYAVFAAEDMQRFLVSKAADETHEIICQYRDYINKIISEREDALVQWDWSYDFVQYNFMCRLRDALVQCRGKWADAIKEDVTGCDEVTKGANRGGEPWTQYWFCSALFWRLDASNRLRLRVWTEDMQKMFPGWTDNTWVEWMDIFQRLLREHGLAEAPFQRRMYSGNGLVQEGTMGAVALPDREADKSIPRVARLHAAFLQEIGPDSNDARLG